MPAARSIESLKKTPTSAAARLLGNRSIARIRRERIVPHEAASSMFEHIRALKWHLLLPCAVRQLAGWREPADLVERPLGNLIHKSQKREFHMSNKFKLQQGWAGQWSKSICFTLATAFTLLVAPARGALQERLAAEAEAEPAGRIKISQPGPRDFILDEARLIDPADAAEIRKLCDKLLTDRATPIVVVTINSMAEHGGAGMRIETFARLLFDQWGVGHAKANDQDWNTGILLLVSKDDRKARIELGAGWRREHDSHCQQIMEQVIVPRFKQGVFSTGILLGVKALDEMARGPALDELAAGLDRYRPPRPWWHYALVASAIGIAIFSAVSLFRRGASGWAWLLWAAVFSAIGYLLYTMMTNSNRSDGGGFSGGSFGGGFSGGGGASGSW
jgi:uncharacterized protein